MHIGGACKTAAINLQLPHDSLPSGACAQFGPSEVMQQHGFARNLDWAIAATSADLQPDERDPSVELVLTDNDYTRAMWWGILSAVC